jgi:hypothetical protein
MKTKNLKKISINLTLSLMLVLSFISCNNDDSDGIVFLIIEKTSITEGIFGDEVIITGTGFSASPTANLVTFNGKIADVISSTKTTITTRVPDLSSSGAITVTVNNQEAPGPNFNVILPLPSIIGYSSFEEVTTFIGDTKYRKIADDAEFTNTQVSDPSSEDPYVDFSATGAELGFDSTYDVSTDASGSATSEKIGVFSNANMDTDPTEFEARFEDGTQGYVVSDQDDVIKITFDETTLTERTLEPKIEVKFFIASASFEEGEGIQVYYQTAAGLGTPILEYLDDDAEALSGVWQTVTGELPEASKVKGNIVIRLAGNNNAEMIWVDSVYLRAIVL